MNTLNERANEWLQVALADSEYLQIRDIFSDTGGTIVDFGIDVPGGLNAGIVLSEICMSNLADVSIVPSNLAIPSRTAIQVVTDKPALACMASQYAGWPIQHENYFAMGSGPMRLNRGKEPVLEKYFADYGNRNVVGVLESDSVPPDEVIHLIARECSIEPFGVSVCIAPTQSIAGSVQIVARSVEATMHKIFELDFDINRVCHAWGVAPLPPVGGDWLTAIGRTNDAILYGGQVHLWINASDDHELDDLAEKLPSGGSKDYGKPFKAIFEHYGKDFYAIDKMLFSAAQVTLTNVQSGHTKTVGKINEDLLSQSFES